MKCFAGERLNVLGADNRIAIIVSALSVSASVCTVAYASYQFTLSKESYQMAKHSSLQNDRLAKNHIEDLTFLETNKELLERWLDSEKIGRIEEIAWVEVLLDVSVSVDTQEFKYKLRPLQSLDEWYGRAVAHVDLSEGVIELDFVASHGDIVFGFFRDIGQRAPGAFRVQELKVTRMNTTEGSDEFGKVAIVSTSEDGDSSVAVHSEISNSTDKLLQQLPSGFGGVRVNATLRWFQIELAAG